MPASKFSSSRTPDTYGLTGKKTGGRGTGLSHMHMSCEKTCNMQHRAKKRAKTMQNHAMQNHAMQNHVMQNHVMPKPCKKQAVPRVMSCKKQAVPHAKPCKKQAVPRVMSCKKQAVPHAKTMQKPCKMRRVRSDPLNIHSPPAPCYMCYMCYMALYSTYSTDFARTEYIVHIVHIARSWGRVGVQRLGV